MKRRFVVAAIDDRGAGVSDPGYSSPSFKPTIESLVRISRQRSFSREPDRFLQQLPERHEVERRICHSRKCAADFSEEIGPAQNSLAQTETVFLNRGVKQFRLQQRQIHVRGAFWRATFTRKAIAQCRVQ